MTDEPDGTSSVSVEQASPRRTPTGCLIEVAETLILTIIIFFLIQTFVAQPYQVHQESMETTLLSGQNVLVDKLTPRFDSYSRGDIVVFTPVLRTSSCEAQPDDPDVGQVTPYIKRVIGEPGDTVDLRAGGVFINGVQLDEPYIRGVDTRQLSDETSWVVQPDRLFVLGDNRMNSVDSRSESIGEVCVRDVIGRAWLRYWPLNALGILQTPVYPE
ncbi:MAG TPA: signal peptidase I [Candidatus Limnocylindrales bacterium]|nr:signal peptidase I [Candidatus Limnocylindrales bacterium]